MESTKLWSTKEYIQIRQSNIASQVACRSIYELYNGAEWMPGSSWMMMWWYQDVGREEEESGAKCSLNLIV